MPTTLPSIASEPWEDELWEDLLAYIEEGRVIPIVGPDLLSVPTDAGEIPLYRWAADQLAAKLGVATDSLPAGYSLNEVVCAHHRQCPPQDRDKTYPRLRNIMREATFEPPEALRRLAAITDFNLYITTTFDSLLEKAVELDRGVDAEALAYAPNKLVDLPAEKERLMRPTVYHLFGVVSTTPSYAVSDEDVLEFVCSLQTASRSLERLFDALHHNHLLFLGCGFPDWLERFFLRTAKSCRLSEARDFGEFVADNHTSSDPDLVVFLQHVSSRTRVYRGGGAAAFVEELWRRWSARHPAVAQAPAQAPERFAAPAREMPDHAVFISYAREDLAAVQRLKSGLDAAGVPVWFDMDRLESGDDYDRKIQRCIARCGFFIPIISATTQRRVEGYFRREWRYALDRALNMADGALFIMPLVIDDTMEAGALVPDQFRASHWTRLPGGEVTAAFAQRLHELVGRKAMP